MPSSAWKKKVCSDRKSTRLNSSHTIISYAVFCLKTKNCRFAICRHHGPQLRGRTGVVLLTDPAPSPLPLFFVGLCPSCLRHPPSRFFFFNDPAPPEIPTLPLHDAFPI